MVSQVVTPKPSKNLHNTLTGESISSHNWTLMKKRQAFMLKQ